MHKPQLSFRPMLSRSGIKRARLSFLQRLSLRPSALAIAAAQLVEQRRPLALRDFDQIPMRVHDLARQVEAIAPQLSGQRVAFVGDYDGASTTLMRYCVTSGLQLPSAILVLDFDKRVLEEVACTAAELGLGGLVTTRPHNVFRSVPEELRGQYDWFYVNPPYGGSNSGESVVLFIARGAELASGPKAQGCIIIPDDSSRPWTQAAMHTVQKELLIGGWTVAEKSSNEHGYHLDDDALLQSVALLVRHDDGSRTLKYAGQSIASNAVPHFYGKSLSPPYPLYVELDGSYTNGIDTAFNN